MGESRLKFDRLGDDDARSSFPGSWKPFLEFLEAKFPKLARRYRDFYRGYGDAPEEYRERIKALVDGLREKYGLGSRPVPKAVRWHSPQLALTLETVNASTRELKDLKGETWVALP